MIKKIFLVVIIGLICFVVYRGIKFVIDEKTAWRVEITNDYINLREESTLYSNKIGQVKKGEVFKVLEIYLDDQRYVWYKIKTKEKKTGWISSGRKNQYVKEINNPEQRKNKDYVIDYGDPVVTLESPVYNVNNISAINYDHVKVTDHSKCEITHIIYIERLEEGTQYWIRYFVKDQNGHETSKMQKIIFEVNPNDSEVTDFSEYKKEVEQKKAEEEAKKKAEEEKTKENE